MRPGGPQSPGAPQPKPPTTKPPTTKPPGSNPPTVSPPTVRPPTNTPKPPVQVAPAEIDVEGVVSGQATAVSFGTVNTGQTALRSFTIRNLGGADLSLKQLTMPAGFKAMNSLPRSLPRQTSFILLVSMDTSAAGPRSGTITIASDDADESLYRIPVSGSVNQTISSDFGTVESWQTIYGGLGSMVLKTVRTNNASGNNLRLYADFLSPNGTPYRRDVLIGNPNSVFGDQSTPQVAALDMGRYAIAWRTTGLSGRTDIRYAIMDSLGGSAAPDGIANIAYSTQLELRSVSKTDSGFRISWFDATTRRSVRRDFNMAGIGITGEIIS